MDERKKPGLWGLEPRRKAAGYTQEQLAAVLGVSRQTLSAWESCRTSPLAAQLPEIAARLHCSIGALFEAPEEAEKRAAGGVGPYGDMLPEEATSSGGQARHLPLQGKALGGGGPYKDILPEEGEEDHEP